MTDRERLEKAFAELSKAGFQAHTRFWCCMSCGLAALPDDTTQWVFWHEQDDIHAYGHNNEWMNYREHPHRDIDGEIIEEPDDIWKQYNTLLDPLHLRWGGDGKKIIEVLNRHGFHVVENAECDPSKTIAVISD